MSHVEKVFTLHDGESDQKTEELHSFMADAGLDDWEGDESGLTVFHTFQAGVGDQIVVAVLEDGTKLFGVRARQT